LRIYGAQDLGGGLELVEEHGYQKKAEQVSGISAIKLIEKLEE
jgi:hypothetical protein